MAYFRGSLFSEGLIIEEFFAFQNGLDLFIYLFIYFILLHTNNITKVINKRRKEEEIMMTIVARKPKRNYKAYHKDFCSWAIVA